MYIASGVKQSRQWRQVGRMLAHHGDLAIRFFFTWFSIAQWVYEPAFSLLRSGCMRRTASNPGFTRGRQLVSFRFEMTWLCQSIKIKTNMHECFCLYTFVFIMYIHNWTRPVWIPVAVIIHRHTLTQSNVSLNLKIPIHMLCIICIWMYIANHILLQHKASNYGKFQMSLDW